MPSILENKNTSLPSVFQPAALLREARRQKNLAAADVPAICVLALACGREVSRSPLMAGPATTRSSIHSLSGSAL